MEGYVRLINQFYLRNVFRRIMGQKSYAIQNPFVEQHAVYLVIYNRVTGRDPALKDGHPFCKQFV